MKKKLLFLIVLGTAALLFIFRNNLAARMSALSDVDMIDTQPSETKNTDQTAQRIELKINQSIISPVEVIEDENLTAYEGESALDIVRRTHTVELKHFDFGDIVDSIDGTVGGQDGKYWIFYVNGKMSQVGAGEYRLQAGDAIIWKFQKENEGL